jgi:uncharacterized protein YcbK (DUF882 family)
MLCPITFNPPYIFNGEAISIVKYETTKKACPTPAPSTSQPIDKKQTVFTHPAPTQKISQYFTVSEFTRNNSRKFISQKHYDACKSLALALDDVRETYKKPIIITSALRTPEQNKAAGGASSSMHLTTNETCAVDVIVQGVSNYKVFDDFNSSWLGGLGRYSNGTTHFDLGKPVGSSRRWDWSNRSKTFGIDEEGFPVAMEKAENGEEQLKIFEDSSTQSASLNQVEGFTSSFNFLPIFEPKKSKYEGYDSDLFLSNKA